MEKTLYAALASVPIISLYTYVGAQFWAIVPCFITCILAVPACFLFSKSLQGPVTLYLYGMCGLLSAPLALHLGHIPFELDYQAVLVFIYGSLLGTWLLTSSTSKPLKVPAVCVLTHRRLAHILSSQLVPTVLPRIPKFLTILSMSSCISLLFVRNILDVNLIALFGQLFFLTVNTCVFFDTCLETTRLFLSLPPDGLDGKKISEGLAKGNKLAFWECSLFVASSRANREFLWEITTIGGRMVNWNQLMNPCMKIATDTTQFIEKNRPRKLDKLSLKKTQLMEVPDLEKVIWSLDTIGCVVYHAYTENKNGVTQVHLSEILKTLFDLDSSAHNSCVSASLKDKISSVLYKICNRYASTAHAVDLSGSYLEKFMQYSDFLV